VANLGPAQLLPHSFDGRARNQPVTEPVRPTRPLFADAPVTEDLVVRREKLGTALAELPDDEILGRKLDQLAAEQLDVYRMQPLTLEWGATTTEKRAVRRSPTAQEQVDTLLPAARPPATDVEVSVLVPYTGNQGLFDLRPSVSSSDTAFGFVTRTALRLTAVAADHDITSALADLERQEATVTALVSAINHDVDAFNAALPGEIRHALSARLNGLRADERLSDTLGIPRHRPTTPVSGGQRRGGPAQAADGDLDPPRRRGRPGWTPSQFQTSWRKAVATTPKPRTYERLAPNFRALAGEVGVSADYLRRLRRRFRWLAE
jgi:hypothetical protein